MTPLDEEHRRAEIAELDSRRRWEPVKTIATILGVLLVLAGLALERISALDLRQQELDDRVFARDIARMEAAAARVEGICLAQSEFLTRSETARTFSTLTLSTAIDRLRGLDIQDAEAVLQRDATIAELEALAEQLETELTEIGRWRDGVALQAQWRVLSRQPTPDFGRLFGERIRADWQALAETGDAALSHAFAITDSQGPGVAEVAQRCLDLTRQLQDRIAAAHRRGE